MRSIRERPGGIEDTHRAAARRYGRQQADGLAAQVERYASVVGGRTLFADIEDGPSPGIAGWSPCVDGNGNILDPCPVDVELNEIVLTAFWERVVERRYVPGLYTNYSSMRKVFSRTYVPRYTRLQHAGQQIPVVVWTTSCGAYCGQNVPAVSTVAGDISGALNAVLAGSRAVMWQYYIPGDRADASCADPYSVDFDATLWDPAAGFVPDVPVPVPADAVACSRD